MIQHHGLEWYGEGATFAEVCNDYTKVEYKCNGIWNASEGCDCIRRGD